MGGLGMDSYAVRIRSAMDVVSEICDTPDLSTIGFCVGGILMSTVLNHLAATGAGRVRAASFAVTLLDFDSRAALGAFSAPRLLELAQKRSRRAWVITGRQLGNVFSWMRPGDLERSGDEAPAPAQLGSGAHPALVPAPGWYVRDRTG